MTKKELVGDDWISEEEMAKVLGITLPSLRSSRARGKAPPSSPLGKERWYSVSQLREWMAKRATEESAPRSRRRR